MSRINVNSTIAEIVSSISEGNPGAMSVVMYFLTEGDILSVLMFDKLELYGSKLYMLWNDCCGRNFINVKKVLDLWQQERISKEDIHEHVSGGYGKPFAEIKEQEK